MLQAVRLCAVSSPSSHPYPHPVQLLPQVDQATSRPSPEAISRKPLGIPLTLLKATLAGVLASVASKGLTGMLTPLDATFTKKRGAGEFSAGTPHIVTRAAQKPRPNSTIVSPLKEFGSLSARAANGKKAICWWLKRISLSKLRATGDRVSFCGTSLSIRITRLIWVAAQTAAA
jgi:hypothetical protein